MKKKYLLPFTLTAVVSALSGCGGESANIYPEKDTMTYANGTCRAGTEGCTEFVLDYPLDGLNFTCSSDTYNSFMTQMDFKNSVVSGTCKTGDKATFFIAGEEEKKISLGTVDLDKISSADTLDSVPRLTILHLAAAITGREAQALNPGDETVKVALKLIKMIQALGLREHKIETPTDIQAVYITDALRQELDSIEQDVTAQDILDGKYETLLQAWADVSKITDQDAFTVLEKLVKMANAAVYNPELALFPSLTNEVAQKAGASGVVGCNREVCDLNDTSIQRILAHFMLITDRQGYTLGSGLQWKGNLTNPASLLLAANLELITKARPVRMTALAQSHWINPLSKRIDQPFMFKVNAPDAQDFTVYQGKLLDDTIMAGQEELYKNITAKTALTEDDKKNLGRWRQQIAGEQFQGSMDLFKIFPITYLDKQVFKSSENVARGEAYIFPLYADLNFTFYDTSVHSVKLGIVIDANGDIRTNIRPNATATDMSTAYCESDSITPDYIDNYDVQQYRLGTTARVFTDDKSISIRMILAGEIFNNIDGALVGMNTRIQTEGNNTLTIGGARVQLGSLLTQSGRTIRLVDSDGAPVYWGNTLASFQNTFNSVNKDKTTQADLELAKLAGGKVEMTLPNCYTVKTKS